jgi:hypothetical protein
MKKTDKVSPDGSKFSELVYKLGKTQVVVRPTKRGAPARKLDHQGKTLKLVEIIKYTPAAKAPKAKVVSPILKTSQVQFTEVDVPVTDGAGRFYVYSDGTVKQSSKGRPHKILPNGASLVRVENRKLVKIKVKVGRKPVPTEEVIGAEKKTVYFYGTTQVVRPEGKRGSPAGQLDGVALSKIVKFIVDPSLPQPEVEGVARTLGWTVGTKAKLKGSKKEGVIVGMNDDYLSLKYPGDPFANPCNPRDLVRL